MAEYESHPFSFAHILDLASRLFGRRWLTVYVAAATFMVPAYALMDVLASSYAPRFNEWVGMAQTSLAVNGTIPTLPADAGAVLATLGFAAIVLLLAGAATAAAIIQTADSAYRGIAAPLRSSLARAIARLPALAGALLIYYAVAAVILCVGLISGSLLVLSGGFLAFVGLIVIVGALAALIFVGMRTSFMQQAIVLEGLGPIAGVVRSWRLTTGSGWRVIGYAIVVGLLSGLVGTMVSGLPDSVLQLNPLVSSDVAVSTVFDAIVDVLVAPITPLVFTLLYYDLRWKHGEPPLPVRAGVSVSEQQA